MKKAKVNQDRCKGCRICMSVCPKDALYIEDFTNQKGYRPMQVDADKCIGCGACYLVCPDFVFQIE